MSVFKVCQHLYNDYMNLYMRTNDFDKLQKYQQEVARLQRSLVHFNHRLARLPAKHGFRSMDDFISALRQAVATPATGPGKKAATGKRRKRATITAETKSKAKALLAAGKTGAEISTDLGISLPSVHNIKRELGLVKKRS